MHKEEKWREIVSNILNCSRCRLHKYRRKAVPGEGNLDAQVLFLGEAPGRREDELGRPFVGAAGKLLDNLLSSIGLRREDVFITNVLKCRPPNNRDPKEDEIQMCAVHTDAILSLIKPKVIVTLGNYAGKYIFEYLSSRSWPGITKARGKKYILDLKLLGEVIVIPTYHPAAALYNPQLKNRLTSDFKLIGEAVKSIHREERKQGAKTLLDFIKSR